MIYFDNSATTLKKPPEVAKAVAYAIDNFGNVGRSFYDAALLAQREIFNTRAEVAKLTGLDNPLDIAFTSSFTESLNLVAGGLVKKEDSVITTVAEHNSVLRPLYLSGCDLNFISCDDDGNLMLDSLHNLIKPSVKYLFCTHGSNLTGNITNVRKIYKACKSNNIIMILDIAQTLGSVPVDMNMADIFCFSGHKGLYGPQGTGGIIVNGKFDFSIVKTGGAGTHSFDSIHSSDMPDIFETGTPNAPGIYGLQQGVKFINRIGIDRIHAKQTRLWELFYNGIKGFDRIKIYGDFSQKDRLPIIAINIDGLTSSELALILWEQHGIATRPGTHCAPLLHKKLGTSELGMVRFSFSYFNTEDEIEAGVSAIERIARS